MVPVSRLLGQISLPDGSISSEALALAAWPRAVGKKIARHTHAFGLRGRTLLVAVGDATWASQLTALKPQILRQLQRSTPAREVNNIEFKVMPPRRQPVSAAAHSGDDADLIEDFVLRAVYKASRKKGIASA